MVIDPTPRRRRQLVGLTPLIDVVFILLVFFMLASSFLDWRSVSLGIPAEGPAVSEAETRSLVVRLFDDGGYALDGESLDLDGLESGLARALASDESRPVVVRADSSVPLRRLMAVVDAATRAGATDLNLHRGGG